jgi:hypothetical protein
VRYTIEGFSQQGLMNIGLDVVDAVILRFIVDFYLSGRMEKITEEDKEYVWIGLGYLLEQMPILNIERRQLSNRIDKMAMGGLIEKKIVKQGLGSKLYVRFMENVYVSLLSEGAVMPTHENERMEKEERKLIKDYFIHYYRMKAIELCGQKKDPVWGGREAGMLVSDCRQVELMEMQRCIRQFFADAVPEVAEFTRFKNKAGYSFAVFHGVLHKIMMTSGHPEKEPCSECGAWSKHRPGCAVFQTLIKDHRLAKELEEDQIKDDLVQVDIAAMFNMAIGKAVLDTRKDSK